MKEENLCVNCKHYTEGGLKTMPDQSIETLHMCTGVKSYVTGEVAKMRCETVRGKNVENGRSNPCCKIFEGKDDS